MAGCQKQESALFYADKANELRRKCLRHPLLAPDASDSPAVAKAKESVREQLQTVEGFQFFACEYSKLVRFLTTDNVTYSRTYWADMEAADDTMIDALYGGSI